MIPKQITFSVPPEWAGVSYSTCCPFAPDGRILLVHRDHYALHAADGTFIMDLPIKAEDEPVWEVDGSILYIQGNALKRLTGGGSAMVHVFSEYPEYVGDQQNGVTLTGEADISEDFDHLVMTDGARREVFTYQISTDTKSKPLATLGQLDGLAITPLNKIVMTDSGGIWLVDDKVTRKLVPYDSHHAVGRDTDGSEILLYARSDDRDGIEKINLSSGVHTRILDYNGTVAAHVSACNNGYCLISTYGAQADGPLANKVIRVPLDGSPCEIVCDTNSLVRSNAFYVAEPRVSISRDGKRFVFNSNSGRTDEPNYADVFLGGIDTSIIVPVNTSESRIDYKNYLGRSEFVLVPQPDGNLMMVERKLT